MNQSQFLEIESKRRKNHAYMHGATGFGFASHWLKNWRESFKPITKRSNRNHVITFDSYLKTTLTLNSKMVGVMFFKPNVQLRSLLLR